MYYTRPFLLYLSSSQTVNFFFPFKKYSGQVSHIFNTFTYKVYSNSVIINAIVFQLFSEQRLTRQTSQKLTQMYIIQKPKIFTYIHLYRLSIKSTASLNNCPTNRHILSHRFQVGGQVCTNKQDILYILKVLKAHSK